jgi:hypothetical protein
VALSIDIKELWRLAVFFERMNAPPASFESVESKLKCQHP